ncbi:MAG TPA: transglutaminase-like domain-containing protein, partial [Acidimicrobiales bacterium]|nr:transglutaminase-like domain-containing protein [Acidimicrobiales bacterium]
PVEHGDRPVITERPEESSAELLRRAVGRSPLGRLVPVAESAGFARASLAVCVAASVFVAALPALRAYRVPAAAWVLAGAAAGPVAVAFLAAPVLRLRAVTSYGLSLIGLVLLLLAADGPHSRDIADTLAHGPNRVFTVTLPLSGDRATISALVLVVWLCGAATAEWLVRTPSRRAPAALMLPVVLYVLCYALASAAPTHDRVGGPLLLGTLGLAATVRAQLASPATADPDAPVSRWRPILPALASVAAVAGGLAAVAPAVPALRQPPASVHRRPPTRLPVITDPVDSMGQLRDRQPGAAPGPLLTAVLSEPSPGYLGLAYLDDYDGGQWRFSATFQPTGGRVPPAPGPAALLADREVTQRIDIVAPLPVPLLPALDRPTAVTGVDAATDPATGMLLPQSGSGRISYTVVSRTSDVGLLGLSPADPISPATSYPGDTGIPPDTAADLATTVRFVSGLTGERPAPTVAFLQDALRALHARARRIDPSVAAPPRPRSRSTSSTALSAAPAGTSLSEVINAVTVDRAATPEQYATFFAVMARYLGVPSRVVTGFRLAADPSGRVAAAGTYQVTNRQAWAWVEVPVEGFGWVVADPTPGTTTAVAAPPPAAVSAPSTTVPAQANAVPRNQAGGHPVAPPHPVRAAPRTSVPAWLLATAAAVALAAVLVLVGPGQAGLRRVLRRRRRRSAVPPALAIGAWLELLDGLDRAGMRTAPCATGREVAAEMGHHFGVELVPDAVALAETADRALFSSRSVTAEAAAEAWESARRLRRRALATLDRRQRLRSAFLVGSAPSRPYGPAPD